MKKLNLFILALFLGTTLVFASGKPALNIIPISADRVLVAMENEKPSPMEVRITDENGQTVFYKNVRRPGNEYRKIYDLTALENGRYEVTFNIDNTRAKRNIEIEDNQVKVSEIRYSYEPMFQFENDKLKITYLNFDQEDFNLRLYRNGQLVYESKLGNDFAITRGFNLSRLDFGNYDVVLSSNQKQYYHTVRVN